MTEILIGLGIGLVLVILLGLLLVAIYNRLVQLRNRFENAFSQIDVQLKRRYDLIPNLVETVRGYMGHERETLEAVIAARNQAFSAGQQAASHPGQPDAMHQLRDAEAQLGGALGRLLAIAEAYPELKANQNMAKLQEELSSTENKIAFSRQAFNDAVMGYNTYREQFPAVIIANSLGFTGAELFEIGEPKEREAPRVQF